MVVAKAIEEEAMAVAMEAAIGALEGKDEEDVRRAGSSTEEGEEGGSEKHLPSAEASTLQDLEFFDEFTNNFESGVPSLKDQSR